MSGKAKQLGGKYLCSDDLKKFNVAGDLGQSVYQVAFALRTVIKKYKPNQHLEKFLAIPQASTSTDQIDWYADESLNESGLSDIQVINWNQASKEEQLTARKSLLEFEKSIQDISESIKLQLDEKSGAKDDAYIYSRLLPKSLITPSVPVEGRPNEMGGQLMEPSYVYLVGKDKQPVLTFWGFRNPANSLDLAPFHFLDLLDTQETVKTAPALVTEIPESVPAEKYAQTEYVSPPVVAKRSWWDWLKWLLLALLLFLLLFFGLRSCTNLHVGGFGGPNFGFSGLSLPDWFPFGNRNTTVVSTAPKAASGLGLGSGVSGSMPAVSNATPDGAAPPSANFDQANTDQPDSDQAIVDQPGIDELGNQSVNDIQDIDQPEFDNANNTNNANNVIPPEIGDLSEDTLAPISTEPPQIKNQKLSDLENMNGDWNVYGIQDQSTGRPLSLKYHIDGSEGTVNVKQSSGEICSGPVAYTGQNSSASISSSGQASCQDGASYEMPEIKCELDANNKAVCYGWYGNQKFPVSLHKAD